MAKLRQVSDLPSGTLGFYAARVGGTAAFAVRGDRPGLGGEEVLLHEYAHRSEARGRAAGVAMVERLIAGSPTDAGLLYRRRLVDFFTLILPRKQVGEEFESAVDRP